MSLSSLDHPGGLTVEDSVNVFGLPPGYLRAGLDRIHEFIVAFP